MNTPNTQHVLIIEDDLDLQMMIVHMLRPFHCTIHTAQNGVEGMDLLQNNRYDLVILDLNLPHIRGEALLRFMRQSPDLQDVVVIITTVFNAEQIQDIAALANYILQKPYALQEFRQIVGRALDQQG
ncbi:MAG: response regulator [Anaerolineales bacterium]